MTNSSKRAAMVVGGIVLAGLLVLVGITFFALSVALPVALVVAAQIPAYVSPSDIALAERLNAIWPLFAIAAIASLIASLAVIAKVIQPVDRPAAA